MVDEFRCLIASLYGRTFSITDSKITVHGNAKADDVAMRCAYYGNASLSAREMKAGYDRDGQVLIFAALNNNNLLSSGTLRKTFEEDMVGGDLAQRYMRNFNLKKERSQFLESYFSNEFVEETSPSADNAHIEITHGGIARIERQVTSLGKRLANLQQLTIGVAVGLALALYFKG